MLELMARDKKNTAGQQRLVLLKTIGKAYLKQPHNSARFSSKPSARLTIAPRRH